MAGSLQHNTLCEALRLRGYLEMIQAFRHAPEIQGCVHAAVSYCRDAVVNELAVNTITGYCRLADIIHISAGDMDHPIGWIREHTDS